MGKWMKTLLFLVGSAILTHLIPFSSFFRNVDTMIHEFGHAIVTLVLSGQVMYIELYVDHSGITQTSVTNHWAIIPIALAGYATASLFAWFLFSMYAQGNQRFGLMIVMAVALLSLVFFVRNGFGISWLIGFVGLTILLLAFTGKTITNYYYLFISFLVLEESVFGPLSLSVYAFYAPRRAGDASILSSVTFVPAMVWAIGFTLFSLLCAKWAIQAFAGRKSKVKYGSEV